MVRFIEDVAGPCFTYTLLHGPFTAADARVQQDEHADTSALHDAVWIYRAAGRGFPNARYRLIGIA